MMHGRTVGSVILHEPGKGLRMDVDGQLLHGVAVRLGRQLVMG
jgi:hypothetical protein